VRRFFIPFKTLPFADRVLLWCAALIMAAVVLETVGDFIEDTREPVAMERAVTMNSPVLPGDMLKVRVYREKVRMCPVQSDRYAVDADGHSWVLGSAFVEGGPVDAAFVDVNYPIPADLPPGDYSLEVFLAYLCPDGPHLIRQPPAKFRVMYTNGVRHSEEHQLK